MKSGGRSTSTRRMLKQPSDRYKRPTETVSTSKEAAAEAFFDLIRAYQKPSLEPKRVVSPLVFVLQGQDRDPKQTFHMIIDQDDSVTLQGLDRTWAFHWGEEDDCSPDSAEIKLAAKKTGYEPDMISELVSKMRGSYEEMRGHTERARLVEDKLNNGEAR